MINTKEHSAAKIDAGIAGAAAKAEFIKIYREHIKREGADKLLAYLEKSDFFTAPASTRFHSSFASGLVEHCVKVYKRFTNMLTCEYGTDTGKWPCPTESVAIIALLHDVCKVGCYKVEERNVKVGNEWLKRPYYAVDDPLPYGHGEKSVYVIGEYMRLTLQEAMAINWHMGGYDARYSSSNYVLSDAFTRFPLCVLFHTADLLTTYLDEKSTK